LCSDFRTRIPRVLGGWKGAQELALKVGSISALSGHGAIVANLPIPEHLVALQHPGETQTAPTTEVPRSDYDPVSSTIIETIERQEDYVVAKERQISESRGSLLSPAPLRYLTRSQGYKLRATMPEHSLIRHPWLAQANTRIVGARRYDTMTRESTAKSAVVSSRESLGSPIEADTGAPAVP
jgi:hypothetical protein